MLHKFSRMWRLHLLYSSWSNSKNRVICIEIFYDNFNTLQCLLMNIWQKQLCCGVSVPIFAKYGLVPLFLLLKLKKIVKCCRSTVIFEMKSELFHQTSSFQKHTFQRNFFHIKSFFRMFHRKIWLFYVFSHFSAV